MGAAKLRKEEIERMRIKMERCLHMIMIRHNISREGAIAAYEDRRKHPWIKFQSELYAEIQLEIKRQNIKPGNSVFMY